MSLIFKAFGGGLSEEDKSFITEKEALRFLDSLRTKKVTNKYDNLNKRFPFVSKDLLDLLVGMLEFNPYLRITAKDALKSKIFDKIRQPIFEVPCPKKINMDEIQKV